MKYDEVNVVNGAVVGVFLGTPMQDATPDKPEDNEVYATERNTQTRQSNYEDNLDNQPAPPASGGGVTSWNDMKDRPFGDNRKEEEVTIEWDGNTEGMVLANGFCYKVSDLIPMVSELRTGVMVVSRNGKEEIYDLNDDEAYTGSDGYQMGAIPSPSGGFDLQMIYVCPATGTHGDEPGLYFEKSDYHGDDLFVKSLTFKRRSGSIETIDYPFMPSGYPKATDRSEEIVFETTLIMGQGATQGSAPTLKEGVTYSVALDSGVYDTVCTHDTLEGMDVFYLGNAFAALPDDYEGELPAGIEDTGESFYIMVVPGVIVNAIDADGGSKLVISEVTEKITPMAEKFLPNPSDLSAEWIAALKTALGI